MRIQPNRAQLQKVCDLWNLRHPVGTPIEYQRVKGDTWDISITDGEAYVMGGHTAVIMLKGVSGCFALDHVRPRLLTSRQAAD